MNMLEIYAEGTLQEMRELEEGDKLTIGRAPPPLSCLRTLLTRVP